ncbi:hypothetical protein LTR05_008638 [Lithohypha guttulata]|uniref:Sugar phosphate transporter domain-containing protein n=1 Tax=Lithohypha guttulata TaxID=1690604 RepID=A0AAN7PS42_9EURO|nr:hypothetical protein LTR05_008638 [Lithohypha guttulata]
MALDWPLVRSLLPHLLINLLLSLSNKHTLNQFPFPWTVTALHAATTCLGSYILSHRPSVDAQPRNTPRLSYTAILLFSLLFTINIAVSNLSLKVASLAFHQVVRSTSPLFVLLIQRLWSNNTFSFRANRAAGPLTMTVVGNLKQLATIVVGVFTFKTQVSLTGAAGMSMALGGSGWYSFLSMRNKGEVRRQNEEKKQEEEDVPLVESQSQTTNNESGNLVAKSLV